MSTVRPEPVADLIGESVAMRAARAQVARVLEQSARGRRWPPILLQGETGTGKGLLARAVHAAGGRGAGPFTDVNCAAIPETLLESEMFGYEKGAFTGAGSSKPGLFQAAAGGTIFLDEIGLLPESLQSKLLKVVEERKVRRLGATRSEPTDVAIVAATSENLDTAVQAGRFRADLYHRLAVVTIRLPPLRERDGDVLLLAEHFLARAAADYGLTPRSLGDDAKAALLAHAWPGNVRELANVIERASLLAESSTLSESDLDLKDTGTSTDPPDVRAPSLRDVLERTEHDRLVEALERTRWNLSRAAVELGIPRNTLRYRMERLSLRPPPPSRRRVHPTAPSPAPVADEETGSVATTTETSGVAWQRRRLALLSAAVELAAGGFSAGMARAVDLLAEKVRTFGGHVEEIDATGVVASFGREPAEDAPRRAALAALAMHAYAARAIASGTQPPPLRLGVHVEECEVGPTGISAASRGRAWSTLARLRALAPAGAIVASAPAAESLQRRFGVVALGELDEARAYRLVGPERATFDGKQDVSPFVGRRGELALLRSRLAALLDGQGHVIGIVGDAGIGKSRLVFELCQDAARSATAIAETRCVSYGAATPYLPIAGIIRQLCGIADAEPADATRAKLEAYVGDAESATYLMDLLGVPVTLGGMTPDAAKARTCEAAGKLLVELSRRHPLLLVIEDLHWIDKASEELLGALMVGGASIPVLVVLTYRPGYRATWLDHSYVTQMALPPLSPEESFEVVRATLTAETAVSDVTRRILARGQGNPFFLEELSRAVAERPDTREVPATVHDVLAARIARLDTPDRALLQSASVIGRDVPLRLLVSIGDDPEPVVVSRLRRLVVGEFLTLHRTAAETAYRFKHALTHEVAYRTVLDGPRRALHARVVAALERAGADRSAEDVERLARHAVQAELWEKAVTCFRHAAKAVARSAAREAVVLLERGLAALAHLPDTPERAHTELGLQMALAISMIATQGYGAPSVERAYARARELCGQVGQTPRLLGAMLGLWAFHRFRGELHTAQELAEQCLAVAPRFPDSPLFAWAHLSAGVGSFWRGDVAFARMHLERVLAMSDPDRHGPQPIFYGQDICVTCLGYLGWLSWLRGDAGRAAESASRAIALADRLSHPFSRAVALSLGAGTCVLRREPALARERAEAALVVSTEQGFPSWAAMGTFIRGWAMSEQGQAQGIEEMRRGVEAWRALGSELAVPWFLALLAQALIARGDAVEAVRLADEALAVAARTGERWCEAELHRVRGCALAALGRGADAEHAFARAAEGAREQHMPALELRATLALVEAGRSDARDALSRLCAQLSAGEDTADLVKARAMLGETS